MRLNNSGGAWFAVAVAVFLATVAYAAVVTPRNRTSPTRDTDYRSCCLGPRVYS